MSENDYQPQELKEGVVEENHYSQNDSPKIKPMISSKEKLKYRKVPLVLQYHVPSEEIYPEEHAHQMLFMYFPLRDKVELKCNNSCSNKSKWSSINEIVTSNRGKFEPYSTIFEDAFQRLDPFGKQKNDVKQIINWTVNFLVQMMKPMMQKQKYDLTQKELVLAILQYQFLQVI